jgi:vacuolar-type H+-ATPase subunit H
VVQGLDLVKDLAELERELAKKLDEAHQSAKQRVAGAEQEAQRILAEADAQIRVMADTWNARIAQENEKYTEDARVRAESEARRIREQAERNMDRAVDFILSEVLP